MEVKNKVIEIVANIMQINKNTLETQYESEKPWDSFQNVEIIFAIEEEFEIMLQQEALANIKTLKNLVEIVEESLVEA